MAAKGDNVRPRSIKVEFDDDFGATSHGGAAVVAQVMRGLGVRQILGTHLPERAGKYTSEDVVEQLLAGLLVGQAKGFQATTLLGRDAQLARIFGFGPVADAATLWRAMNQIAGLELRKFDEAYEPAGPSLERLDIFGAAKPLRSHRRVVAQQPEAMDEQRRAQMLATLQAIAGRCRQGLGRAETRLGRFTVGHGDGTDLEVEGQCFDAARRNHEGRMSLRLMSVSVGPFYAALRVLAGASDEGKALPALLAEAQPFVEAVRDQTQMLMLLDAAFAEKGVIDELRRLGWRFIVCANQQRLSLEKLAREQPEADWINDGPDERRGWAQSQVMHIRHMPANWCEPLTLVMRRWRNVGEMPGTWHHSFLYTDLTSQDLTQEQVKEHGLARTIWRYYSTKQGHENNYKPLLSDMGLHHPPSGRLAATEAMAFACAMAAAIHALIARRVVAQADRGIRPWRFVRDYILIPAQTAMRAGKTLLVTLAGKDVEPARKARWLHAWQGALLV
jgi:hypothetical protein